jgi:hypothetical protein
VGEAAEFPEPSIRYRWIKANVYSALFNVVTSSATLALGAALAVRDPDTGAVTVSIFVALAGMITALGLAVYARLTGGVLARKIPSFPMHGWIALHAVIGCLFGMAVAPAATVPDEYDPESLDFVTAAFATLISSVIGAVVGASFGGLQAIILRKVARGLMDWIGFSALAGTTLGLVILITSQGPQSGLGFDVMGEIAAFIITIVIGLIMLPAVRRLQPREAPTPAVAPDSPPPPAPAAPPPP